MQLCASALLCILLCICACLIDRCSLQASQSNISGAAHVYSAPEKRLLSAPVTLHVLIHTWIQFRTGADRHTCTHAHKEPLLNSRTHTHAYALPRVASWKGMSLSADVRTQVCVPVPLAPFVSSSSPEAAYLSVALFHFGSLPYPPQEDASVSVIQQTHRRCVLQCPHHRHHPPGRCYRHSI